MPERRVIPNSGTRAGIGRALAVHYLAAGWRVVGCSRGPASIDQSGYTHHRLDVADEAGVCTLTAAIVRDAGSRGTATPRIPMTITAATTGMTVAVTDVAGRGADARPGRRRGRRVVRPADRLERTAPVR
jgi:3-oxoacyl-[acyl-carrier protein] reductase